MSEQTAGKRPKKGKLKEPDSAEKELEGAFDSVEKEQDLEKALKVLEESKG